MGFTIDVMTQAANHARLKLDLQLPPHAEDRASAIDQLDRNVTDMLGGLWAITVANIKRGADWTVPYHIGHVGALVKRVDLGDDIWGFFAPFTPLAWAFFFLLVLLYGLLTYALEQGHNDEFPHTEDPNTSLGTVVTELLWHCAMFSLKDRDKPIKTTAAKTLTVIFSFVVVVVLASYTANLAAFMISASTTEHYVKSEEDLKSKKVAVLCGQSTEAWVKSNNIAAEIVCSQTMLDAVDMVKKGLVDAALGWIDELHYNASQDCNVEVSAVTMHATEFSFPVSRSDDVPSWRYSFNAALFRLRETGEFHKLRQKWFEIGQSESHCDVSGSETNPDKAQIQLTNVIGLAGVLVAGLTVGGIIELMKSAQMLADQLNEKLNPEWQKPREDSTKVDVNPTSEPSANEKEEADEGDGLLHKEDSSGDVAGSLTDPEEGLLHHKFPDKDEHSTEAESTGTEGLLQHKEGDAGAEAEGPLQPGDPGAST